MQSGEPPTPRTLAALPLGALVCLSPPCTTHSLFINPHVFHMRGAVIQDLSSFTVETVVRHPHEVRGGSSSAAAVSRAVLTHALDLPSCAQIVLVGPPAECSLRQWMQTQSEKAQNASAPPSAGPTLELAWRIAKTLLDMSSRGLHHGLVCVDNVLVVRTAVVTMSRHARYSPGQGHDVTNRRVVLCAHRRRTGSRCSSTTGCVTLATTSTETLWAWGMSSTRCVTTAVAAAVVGTADSHAWSPADRC